MRHMIVILVAGSMACSTLLAFQPIERTTFSPMQVVRMEKQILAKLESPVPQHQIEAGMMLHRVMALAPEHEWDRCIIPLIRILNRESNDPAARLIAAMTLHELRSERGDFAISRNALFTDDPRVKRYCALLNRTRQLEKLKS